MYISSILTTFHLHFTLHILRPVASQFGPFAHPDFQKTLCTDTANTSALAGVEVMEFCPEKCELWRIQNRICT